MAETKEEYFRKLIDAETSKQVKIISEMEARLDEKAIKLQKELFELIKDKYLDNLATDEAGNLIYNHPNLVKVSQVTNIFNQFKEKSFNPAILEFGKDLLSIVDLEGDYFKAIDANISIEKTFKLISQQIGIDLKTGALIEDSYLYRLAEGSQVKDDIANLVLQNVSAKSSFRDLKNSLQTLVEGDETTNGAMQQYLRTYAYDTFSNVQRAVDLNIADTYQFNSFIYSGDIIKDTREFCAERINGIFTRDDLAEWSTMEWKGKNPDVPVEISLGGYNCRHTLMWIPDEAREYFSSDANIYETFSKDIIEDPTSNSELGRGGSVEVIDRFKKKINKYFKDNDLSGNMYFQESFTGYSHYINTKLGKIRLSDHEIPRKADIYSPPIKNVIIDDQTTNKEAFNKITNLFKYISKNKDNLFE